MTIIYLPGMIVRAALEKIFGCPCEMDLPPGYELEPADCFCKKG